MKDRTPTLNASSEGKLSALCVNTLHYSTFAFKKKISKKILDNLNLGDLDVEDNITIDELIKKIAENTLITQDGFIKRSNAKQSDFTLENEYKNTDYIEALGKGKIQPLSKEVYNYEQNEFREDFLWYIMSDYGNYNFNKMIFEHFMEDHKKKYKIHGAVEYTTEIHKLLYKVVDDENIRLGSAFHNIFNQINNIDELKAFYTLCFEFKGYQNHTSIIDIINCSLEIIDGVMKLPKEKTFYFKDKRILLLNDIRPILELIKLDGQEITVDNVLKYSEKNTPHMYQTGNASALYNAIYLKLNSESLRKDTTTKKGKLGFVGKKSADLLKFTNSKVQFEVSEKVLTHHFSVVKFINTFTRDLLSKWKGYKKCDTVTDSHGSNLQEMQNKKKIIREGLLKQKKFINALENVIESFIEAEKDNILGKKSGFNVKGMFAKVLSRRGLEEIWKITTLTSSNSKIWMAIIARRLGVAVVVASIGYMLRIIINKPPLKRARLAYGILNGYKFDISPELKSYIIENVHVLIQLSNLEAEKQRITTVCRNGKNRLCPLKGEEYSERLEEIEEIFLDLDKAEVYKGIREIIAANIRFQNRSFHEEVMHRYGEEGKMYY